LGIFDSGFFGSQTLTYLIVTQQAEVAACLTFITPFGHHANTPVFGQGQYKFTDFSCVGLPLNMLFWILAVIFISLILSI